MSANYTAFHGHTESLTHWERPGIEPASSWVLAGFFTAEPQRELPSVFFEWMNIAGTSSRLPLSGTIQSFHSWPGKRWGHSNSKGMNEWTSKWISSLNRESPKRPSINWEAGCRSCHHKTSSGLSSFSPFQQTLWCYVDTMSIHLAAGVPGSERGQVLNGSLTSQKS